MALYDHICRSCGHTKEYEYSMKETRDIKCEKCGGETYRPLNSATFKITGAGVNSPGFSFTKKKHSR